MSNENGELIQKAPATRKEVAGASFFNAFVDAFSKRSEVSQLVFLAAYLSLRLLSLCANSWCIAVKFENHKRKNTNVTHYLLYLRPQSLKIIKKSK